MPSGDGGHHDLERRARQDFHQRCSCCHRRCGGDELRSTGACRRSILRRSGLRAVAFARAKDQLAVLFSMRPCSHCRHYLLANMPYGRWASVCEMAWRRWHTLSIYIADVAFHDSLHPFFTKCCTILARFFAPTCVKVMFQDWMTIAVWQRKHTFSLYIVV